MLSPSKLNLLQVMGIESSKPPPIPEGADPNAPSLRVPFKGSRCCAPGSWSSCTCCGDSPPFTFDFECGTDPKIWKSDKTVPPWYWAVKPGMDQLLLEVDQIAAGANRPCCLEHCCNRNNIIIFSIL